MVGGNSVSTACLSTSRVGLAKLAASMKPGTWAQLPVLNQDALLGVGSVSKSMIHYCNSMPWNPVSKVIEIIGADHNYPALRYVRYDSSTNQFVLVADNAGLGAGHGYNHTVVNPYTGDLYHRLYSGFSGRLQVRKKTFGASGFNAIPDVPASDQVAIGACWWSGAFSGAGAQGCFMLFNSGNAGGSINDGQIAAYDPLSGQWFYSQEGKAPFYGNGETYHSVMAYSAPRNVAVYGGGNVAASKLWRLDPDRTSIAMTDVPQGKGAGVQKGLLVDEPTTGNFLLLSAGELWELNPSGAGSWKQMTGSRTPPDGVGRPGPTNPQAVICTAIADLGVVAFISQFDQSSGSFYLYKHA